MATPTEPKAERRTPLSKERVLRAAVRIADRDGIEAVTMRNLADKLGAEAMSLYYHVANKEAVLDGMVDAVIAEINEAAEEMDAPSPEEDWKTAMRMRILAAREVLLCHPWAPGVIETRSAMSPQIVRYFESVLGIFRKGGFSNDLAHHAMHALGSRALGFTQELFEPDDGDDAETSEMLEHMADELPYLVGMMLEVAHDDPDSTLGWCDDQTEFEFGLDLILDGLERLRQTTSVA
ncbi:MAG TPA: TetR/AcrR family transcriptional regulator C-terminal domain-containing protein [Acidimicrobiia bacterium]|nr:TetR/AcrR family transcriptional regulator C-terminal domain-containing protein [Acidimicrobiia bacterium]